ncbi:inactive protein RESTRICTED TEV MOVEMENT 2-like [Phoenix dactylifera]|uniref:Inactive protein RESTRICTED TEV MOVEMENT 2-like n=1 Tax=Phoenix dactylifera TaxID=42345 RepID=A0A8B7CXZ6_PHODC|nr:inactive protein RESTRICTED TEV MOVEMENT 2-like [Phoenix dactylifera]
MDTSKSPTPNYQDVDPEFEWSQQEGSYTLRVHLPGFKRENLRVQLDDDGNLMTSGEQPLDSIRRIRFNKVFKIPEDCNVDGIHAKFENGVLYVIHPKVKTTRLADDSQRGPSPVAKPAEAETQPAAGQQQEERKSSELVDTAQKDAEKIAEKEKDRTAGPARNGKVAGDVRGDEGTDNGIKAVDEGRMEPKPEHVTAEGVGAASVAETVRYDNGRPLGDPTKPMQPLWNVAAAILVLACLAMYMAYKLGKASR